MLPCSDYPFLKFTIIDTLTRNKNAIRLKMCIKLIGREKLVSHVVFLGSLLRAELRCRETLVVLNLERWQRALTAARRAKESLSKAQKELKSTDSLRLTKSSYLYTKGEYGKVTEDFAQGAEDNGKCTSKPHKHFKVLKRNWKLPQQARRT